MTVAGDDQAFPARAPSDTSARRADAVAAVLLVGLAAALWATVFGEIAVAGVRVRYKTLWRALPIIWLASLALPGVRAALAPRWRASDRPLLIFAAAAALSVAVGGGHWGDVRSLVAAIGVGLMARALFHDPARHALAAHALGLTALVILAHELRVHPTILPPHEMGRYDLVTANPNVLGFLFAMMLPLLLAEVLASRGRRRLAVGLYTAAAVLGTLLTFSRTAAVGAAAGSAVVLLGGFPRGRGALVLALLAVGFLAVQRPDQWTPLRTTGDAQRLRIIQTSLAIAAEHPVLGVGFGINNLERVFPDRYEARYGTRVFRFHSMNQVVDLLVGTGIVGTTLALWWATLVGRGALRRWRSSAAGAGRLRAAGGLGACLAIAVMSMGEPPLYHGKLVPLLFVLLASVEAREPA